MLIAVVATTVRRQVQPAAAPATTVQRKHITCTTDKERASSGRHVAPTRQRTRTHMCMYVVMIKCATFVMHVHGISSRLDGAATASET